MSFYLSNYGRQPPILLLYSQNLLNRSVLHRICVDTGEIACYFSGSISVQHCIKFYNYTKIKILKKNQPPVLNKKVLAKNENSLFLMVGTGSHLLLFKHY